MNLIFSRQSLPEAITGHLRDAIVHGEPEDFLPSERNLAEALGVSRVTLRLALRRLELEGLLIRRHGQKTRVCRPSSSPGGMVDRNSDSGPG